MRFIISISNRENYNNIVYFLTRDNLSKDKIYKEGDDRLIISEEQLNLLKMIGLGFKVVGKEF